MMTSYSGRNQTYRPAEIMPGIILEYLAYLGIRELCGNNRGYTGIIAHAYCARKVRTSLGIATAWSRLSLSTTLSKGSVLAPANFAASSESLGVSKKESSVMLQ